MHPPLHFIPLRSGSHSPSSIQVDELDPESTSPVGQLNMIVVPSRAGSLYPVTTLTVTGLSVVTQGHLATSISNDN